MVRILSVALVAIALPSLAAAQQKPDFHWEKSLAAGNLVRVSNVNGDVSVSPSSTGRVEIVGRRKGRGADDITAVVHESSSGIVVCVVHDGDDDCDDSGYHSHRHNDDWNDGQMDLDLRVPANLEISAGSVSGDVSVTGAQGRVRASSVSGDIKLEHLRATSIQGNSVSGDVTVSVDALSGSGSLTFRSVSGSVSLTLPKDFAANLSMSSVSGDLRTDFPLTLNGRMDRRRIEARIGAGGRDLDISTVSGDVSLRIAK